MTLLFLLGLPARMGFLLPTETPPDRIVLAPFRDRAMDAIVRDRQVLAVGRIRRFDA